MAQAAIYRARMRIAYLFGSAAIVSLTIQTSMSLIALSCLLAFDQSTKSYRSLEFTRMLVLLLQQQLQVRYSIGESYISIRAHDLAEEYANSGRTFHTCLHCDNHVFTCAHKQNVH